MDYISSTINVLDFVTGGQEISFHSGKILSFLVINLSFQFVLIFLFLR